MRLSSKISVRSAARAPFRVLVVPAAALLGGLLIAATAATQEPQVETRGDQRRRERFTHNGTHCRRRRSPPPSSGHRPRPRPASTTRPTAWMHRGRPSRPSTRTPSSRCGRSTTTASSSKRPKRSATASGRPTTRQCCRECHQNVVTGGASQIAEHRTGHMLNGQFFESLGGSLVQSRATHPNIVELVTVEDDIRTFRISTNTLGAGFVEAIANSTLLAIRDRQPSSMRGIAVMVPVLEAPGDAPRSAASAGRTSTPAWSRFPPTPT